MRLFTRVQVRSPFTYTYTCIALSRGGGGGRSPQRTFRKIDLLLAALADVLPVEFIGKDLHFFPTTGTTAHKRFQILKLLKSGTVSWDGHIVLPTVFLGMPAFFIP